MRRGSLRLRLLAVWVVFIALTLQASAVGLRLLFERAITRSTIAELAGDMRQIIGALRLDAAGRPALESLPSSALFQRLEGGRYYQVVEGGAVHLRSPSLGEAILRARRWPEARAGLLQVPLLGPDNKRLLGLARMVPLASGAGERRLVVVAAVEHAEIIEHTDRFTSDLLAGLSGLAVLLLLAALAHVSIGMQPIEDLRRRVVAVRAGRSRRIDGEFPDEVMPIVNEANALLEAQDDALAAARARAADLAHGLKTPLAILAAKSRVVRRNLQSQIADDIDRQIEVLRWHVERELARARARGAGRTRHGRIDAAEVTRDLASAMSVLPRAQTLTWQVELDEPLRVAADRADFNDILGNLLDNGQKWARSHILVRGRREGGKVVLTVEDDGPGVPEDEIERILQRGERADPTVAGTGLGLAIVSDLVRIYQGGLELSRSRLGGLKAAVALPAAPHAGEA
jgi:signal transduction histidine kinase